MRLGQVHGAGPFAGGHAGQPGPFLRLGPMRRDCRIGTVGQALIHLERHVGRHELFLRGGVHDVGQALSAEFLGAVHRRPAAVAHLVERGKKPVGRAHDAVFQGASLHVAHCVQRRQHLGRNLAGLFEHRRSKDAIQVGKAGNVLFADLQDVVQDELLVPDGGGVARHRSVSP